MAVDIQASFTEKSRVLNGLEAIETELLPGGDPLAERYIVARIISPTFKGSNLDGSRTPKVQLIGIEPMVTGRELADAKGLYERAYKARTGNMPQEPLPMGDQPQLPLNETDADPAAGPYYPPFKEPDPAQ